jgi:hypothetical protein
MFGSGEKFDTLIPKTLMHLNRFDSHLVPIGFRKLSKRLKRPALRENNLNIFLLFLINLIELLNEIVTTTLYFIFC